MRHSFSSLLGTAELVAVPRRLVVSATLTALAMVGSVAQAQVSSNLLISRADLTAAAARAEAAAAAGDPSTSAQTAAEAASMRQRLRDGDLQVGDRVIVTIVSDAVRRDTVVVGADRTLQLQGMIVVPVAGVLRSELEQRVSSEVLKYIKAEKVEVTPLMRLAVLGAVMKPGYFAFASDMPLGDAIMSAGGPSGTADVGRSIVKRGNQEYKSAGETSKAIAGGLTLDQFGMRAGDELVIGQRRDFGAGTLIGMTGAVASLLTLFVALRR